MEKNKQTLVTFHVISIFTTFAAFHISPFTTMVAFYRTPAAIQGKETAVQTIMATQGCS